MKHKVLDLFAGIGGFSLGLEATGGFETTAFCELDKKAQLVLNKHWPDVPIYEDIKELTYERLQADGNVPSVITGGFPCQDISCAGKAKGILAERSGLWSEMFRLIRDVRPTWAIIENVSALRSKGLTLVLQNLCEIGYMCEWHCIPASAVGAPHQRDRIWIIAYPVSECPQPRTNRDTDRNMERKVEEVQGRQDSKPSGICEDVANPNSKQLNSLFNGSSQEGSGETSPTGEVHSGNQGSNRPNNMVANPNNSGDRTSQRRDMPKIREAILQGWQEHTLSEPGGYCEDVANPTSQRPQGQGQPVKPLSTEKTKDRQTAGSFNGCLSDFWAVEPNVGRVANGVPNRVHRLKQLGNSVVPQIPYLLGCAILSTETLDAKEDTNAHNSN